MCKVQPVTGSVLLLLLTIILLAIILDCKLCRFGYYMQVDHLRLKGKNSLKKNKNKIK